MTLEGSIHDAQTFYGMVVLLVDDQPIIGEALRRVLATEEDIIFHYCSEAKDALATAERLAPSLILQDLVMPEIDGLDLLKQYRSSPHTKQTPIIVLSTKEEPEVKSQAFELGANDYLVKLPDKIELIARIRSHSRAYLNQLQRDAAMAALQDSERRLLRANSNLRELNNQLESANELITRLARQDALTGLSNRRVLDEELHKLWDFSLRKDHPLSVVIVDLDRFKTINDDHGHPTGDNVLRAVAAVISSHMRSYDIAGRYGGEEFLAILPETPLEEGVDIAERLRSGIESMKLNDYPHKVTASFGVAALVAGETADCLLERADEALYQAKKNGRNRVEISPAPQC